MDQIQINRSAKSQFTIHGKPQAQILLVQPGKFLCQAMIIKRFLGDKWSQ